jgi:hypothetical protein
MKNKLVELAKATYTELSKEHDNPFQIGVAKIFAIEVGGSLRTIVTGQDIYDALDEASAMKLLATDLAIGCETTGWAAPVKNDEEEGVAPSQHPERRRCRLVSIVTRQFDVASALGFADEEGEVVTDEGCAKGTLADALLNTMKAMNA